MIEINFKSNPTQLLCPERGWWDTYPLLAIYMAGDCSENSGLPMVPRALPGSEDELSKAEEQLSYYDADRLVYLMGYHKLVDQEALEGVEFMPHTLTGRMY